jgi:hypothetical protein
METTRVSVRRESWLFGAVGFAGHGKGIPRVSFVLSHGHQRYRAGGLCHVPRVEVPDPSQKGEGGTHKHPHSHIVPVTRHSAFKKLSQDGDHLCSNGGGRLCPKSRFFHPQHQPHREPCVHNQAHLWV